MHGLRRARISDRRRTVNCICDKYNLRSFYVSAGKTGFSPRKDIATKYRENKTISLYLVAVKNRKKLFKKIAQNLLTRREQRVIFKLPVMIRQIRGKSFEKNEKNKLKKLLTKAKQYDIISELPLRTATENLEN